MNENEHTVEDFVDLCTGGGAAMLTVANPRLVESHAGIQINSHLLSPYSFLFPQKGMSPNPSFQTGTFVHHPNVFQNSIFYTSNLL